MAEIECETPPSLPLAHRFGGFQANEVRVLRQRLKPKNARLKNWLLSGTSEIEVMEGTRLKADELLAPPAAGERVWLAEGRGLSARVGGPVPSLRWRHSAPSCEGRKVRMSVIERIEVAFDMSRRWPVRRYTRFEGIGRGIGRFAFTLAGAAYNSPPTNEIDRGD